MNRLQIWQALSAALDICDYMLGALADYGFELDAERLRALAEARAVLLIVPGEYPQKP
jgi:hypothetical protein